MRGLWTAALALALAGSGCATETTAPAADEPVVVTAQLDRSQVSPGQPFTLTIEINRREDVTFALPDLGAELQGLVIQDIRDEGPEYAGDRVLNRQLFKLKAPRSGTYLVPGVEAPWVTGDQQVGTAGTGPILVEASHAPGEEGAGAAELRDIKPPALPDPKLSPWLWALAVLVVLGVVAVVLLRRKRAAIEPPPPPPHEVALAALARLRQTDRLGTEDQGPFAYEVSAILRRYLEARFTFRAWRMTTSEVLRALPPSFLTRRGLEVAVREVLEASDRVKFAGERVTSSELEGWVDRASDVVRKTTAAEPADGAPAGEDNDSSLEALPR